MHKGVPEWSILGPVLLIICTTDHPTFMRDNNILSVMYADDTHFSCRVNDTDKYNHV